MKCVLAFAMRTGVLDRIKLGNVRGTMVSRVATCKRRWGVVA